MSSNNYKEQTPENLILRNSIRHLSLNQSVNEGFGFKDKSQELLLPNVQFVDSSKFQKENECIVCGIVFTQTNRQHHCRMCGNSCCGLCSQKSINKNRVCDICFMKASQINAEKKRAKFLQSLKESAKRLKNHIEQAEKRKRELLVELESQEENSKNELREIEKETDQFRLLYSQKTQEKCQKESEMEDNKLQISELISQQDLIQHIQQEKQQEIRAYDTNLYLKEQELNDKKLQLQRLRKQREELENLQNEIEQNPEKVEQITIPEPIKSPQIVLQKETSYNSNIDVDQIMYGNNVEVNDSQKLLQKEDQSYQKPQKSNKQKKKDENVDEEKYSCQIF